MFLIGEVLKPQGVKGEVKVEIITSFPEHFNELKELFIKGQDFNKIQIEKTRFASGFVFVKFKGIDTRSEAENIKNCGLYITEDELYPLNNDEYYQHQLIGLKVFSEEGKLLGKITDIEIYPGSDVYCVTTEKNTTHLIPSVKEFIKEVNIKSGKMIVHAADGLFG